MCFFLSPIPKTPKFAYLLWFALVKFSCRMLRWVSFSRFSFQIRKIKVFQDFFINSLTHSNHDRFDQIEFSFFKWFFIFIFYYYFHSSGYISHNFYHLNKKFWLGLSEGLSYIWFLCFVFQYCIIRVILIVSIIWLWTLNSQVVKKCSFALLMNIYYNDQQFLPLLG